MRPQVGGLASRAEAQKVLRNASERDSPARGRSVDVAARSRRPCWQLKELISRKFLKPSDGLEPSNPSLPCVEAGRLGN
jgi:hypothetical protein